MDPEEKYQQACELLESRYGHSCKIATAYDKRINNYSQIKYEDGESQQKFSVLLTSCKNALKEVDYLNKIKILIDCKKLWKNYLLDWDKVVIASPLSQIKPTFAQEIT